MNLVCYNAWQFRDSGNALNYVIVLHINELEQYVRLCYTCYAAHINRYVYGRIVKCIL